MYIIAKDGTGDFTSIQQAIDAIPGGGRTPTILLLRMDEYHERVVVDKDNVRIIGEARDRTVITAKGCALDKDEHGNDRGTFLSATLIVMGNNVEVENLTIRNADVIWVLTEKGIEETGTHAELMSKGGLYHSLYSMYSGKSA